MDMRSNQTLDIYSTEITPAVMIHGSAQYRKTKHFVSTEHTPWDRRSQEDCELQIFPGVLDFEELLNSILRLYSHSARIKLNGTYRRKELFPSIELFCF